MSFARVVSAHECHAPSVGVSKPGLELEPELVSAGACVEPVFAVWSACWGVRVPDCHRTCFPTGGVLSGLANNCGVLLLPPPVGRLLVGNVFRGSALVVDPSW
jgi:hypothetical protein